MATETAISDHTSATDEQVEKKVNEVKAIEHDGVTSSKESVEEEKPKVEGSPSPATPVSKPEEVSEVDKQIEPPMAEVDKTNDAPVSDVPVEDNTEEKDNIPESHTPAVPQPVADTIKVQSEEQPAVESVVKEAPEQLTASLEKGEEEKANIVGLPEQIPETPEKLEEPMDVLPAKESEVVGIEEIKSSHVEKPEDAAIEAEENPREQSELFEKVEKTDEEVDTKERMEKAKIVDVPEQIPEIPEKLGELLEPMDVLPAKESEVVGLEEIKSSHVEKPEAAAIEAEEKPREQSELFEKVEKTYEEVDTKERMEKTKIVDVPEQIPETPEKLEELMDVLPAKESEVVGLEEIKSSHVEKPEAAAIEAEEKPREQSELFEKVEKTYEEVDTKERMEKTKIADVPEQIPETPEKLEEPLNVLPAKESEVLGTEEIKSSHVESIKVEKPEAAAVEAKEEPREQSELSEQVEKTYEEVDSKEKVEGDTDKDTVTSAEKVENTSFLKDKEEEEPSVIRSSEQVQTNQEAVTDLNENEGDFSLSSNDPEKVDAEEKKELSGADVIGELSKEAVVEAGKVAEENEAKNVETEEGNGKRNVKPEESTPPVKEKDADTAEFIEKSFEGRSTGRDVEEENKGEQNVKEETPALGGTNKDEHVEENQAQVTTVTSKPVEEPKESELQERNEEAAETGKDKLDKEKVDEIEKSDVQNLEPSVDAGDETKTSQDLPKELPAKSSQKQSNNIISKVKQSLVKAKKAIIGKSPSSKTLSGETKGDIKVK
ncbi:uncharacterized protein LOC132187161 [Corylus avellana]|uniref:uncharacterized protein LOC132187161 n=1 Tax=Corylus avellana TaxID=13451 RepID=UPI001E207226|nr:uncharacterized protein LOC132187161 [Corylus avellana]